MESLFKYKRLIYIALGALAMTGIMAIVLYMEGRLPICECGYVKIWHGLVVSSENSQHLFDWYSLTHVLHGTLFYFILWLIDRKKKLSMATKFLIAVGAEAAWEVLENSDMIINRYRAATISLDYFGDSIVNSIGDVFAMIAGFVFAYRAKIFVTIALVLAIELLLLYVIRDNLTTNIIMLIHPIDALKVWQGKI